MTVLFRLELYCTSRASTCCRSPTSPTRKLPSFSRLRGRGFPTDFERPGTNDPMPGLIGQAYAAMGGTVHYVGKPHTLVYDECFALLQVTGQGECPLRAYPLTHINQAACRTASTCGRPPSVLRGCSKRKQPTSTLGFGWRSSRKESIAVMEWQLHVRSVRHKQWSDSIRSYIPHDDRRPYIVCHTCT